jgi:Golgi phosphoprotein 3 (GPP34)
MLVSFDAGGGQRAGAHEFRVADVLFLLAHDEDDRPRLRPRVLAFVLAAGLLGELALVARIGLHEGHVYVCDGDAPGDPLHAQMLRRIADFPGCEPVVWLKSHARWSTDGVIDRLVGAGVLTLSPPRRKGWLWGRGGPAYTVRNQRAAELASLLLMNKLHRRDPLSRMDAYVVGVALAAGLDVHLLEGAPPAAGAYASRVIGELPGLLGQLVAQVDGLIGSEVLLYH